MFASWTGSAASCSDAHGRPGQDPAMRHSPSTSLRPSAKPTAWPRKAHDTTAIPALAATTRCSLSPPAPVRLIVRRVKPPPGSQLALFAKYSYHGFITDRDGETLELEADHRRHAEVENAIRDLKYGVGLNHMPSGRFAANSAPGWRSR